MIDELERQEKLIKTSGDTFICITETQFYSKKQLIKGDIVNLIREYDNEHDPDAIRVDFNGETVGYVANSSYTLTEGISSASDIKYMLVNNPQAEVMFRYLSKYLVAKLL